MSRPYRILGLGLIASGVFFAPISWFLLDSAPLTAVGISAAVLGFTSFALANTRPYISPEASQMILQTGMENIAGLLEELSLRNKAIYLPSVMREGRSQAIIPLSDTPVERIDTPVAGRLIVRYGRKPDDLAIAVATPGSVNLKLLREPVGPEPGQIESAISYLLVGVLDLADAVSVSPEDTGSTAKRLVVEVKKPGLSGNIWYYQSLGSPVASIAAATACEGLRAPVYVLEETYDKGKALIILETLG